MARIFFWATFIANLIMNLVAAVMLPDQVANHFGEGGLPNGWSSNLVNTLIWFSMDLVLFASFWGIPRVMTRSPDKWVNLPDKDYWLHEGRKEATIADIRNRMYEFGAAMFVFFLAIQMLVVQANRADPVRLDMAWFWSFLTVFMVFTGWWAISFHLGYRKPED